MIPAHKIFPPIIKHLQLFTPQPTGTIGMAFAFSARTYLGAVVMEKVAALCVLITTICLLAHRPWAPTIGLGGGGLRGAPGGPED
jgi:hypothetical protein